jgi:hypothetical protein
MPYQLPPAAQTSKFKSLPDDLKKLAEEALAEKFNLPEVLPAKPKVKREKKVKEAIDHDKYERSLYGNPHAMMDYERVYIALDDRRWGNSLAVSFTLSRDHISPRAIQEEFHRSLRQLYEESRRSGSYYGRPFRVTIETSVGTFRWEEGESPSRMIQEITMKLMRKYDERREYYPRPEYIKF